MKLLDGLLSLLSPYDCLGCFAEGALLCADCRSRLIVPESRCYKCHASTAGFRTCPACRAVSPLVSVHSVIKYDGLAKDLVWKLKFGRAQAAASEAADMIVSGLELHTRLRARAGSSAPDGTRLIITHAPTATARVRQRGYDQARLIARAVARQSGVPYAPLLGRSGQQKQVGASRAQRTAQLSTAFRPLQPGHIAGAHIILIDDVVTTGSTLEAAGSVLMATGAQRVDAIVFAQA